MSGVTLVLASAPRDSPFACFKFAGESCCAVGSENVRSPDLEAEGVAVGQR